MVDSFRDPKSLAEWAELDYHRRPRRLRRLKLLLGVVVLLGTAAGLALALIHPRQAVLYQAGPLAPVHAAFNHHCENCHQENFRTVARFWNASATSVPDHACERCHDGPTHNPQQTATPACASCHREHRGRVSLAVVPDGFCTDCHGRLERKDGQPPSVAPDIHSFTADHHPEFALWLRGDPDPGTIRFNHQVHLRETLPGPGGKPVRLECADCHQSDAARAYMLPIAYDKHCAQCHPLPVQVVAGGADEGLKKALRKFAEKPAPHGGQPLLVQGALRERFRQFVREHPEVLADKAAAEPDRALPWKTHPSRETADTEAAWVERQVGYARRLLIEGAGGCRYCHQMRLSGDPGELPDVLPAKLQNRWFSHAFFDHDKHKELNCAECHAALESTSSREVLMPHLDTCQKCHRPSTGARGDCVECHKYHPRGSPRPGTMTIPEFLGQPQDK